MSVVNIRVAELRKNGYNSFKEWLDDPNNVYVGRKVHYVDGTFDSMFRNPYYGKKYNREECIEMFKVYIQNDSNLMDNVKKLKGKNLGCWCTPEKCHADYLLQLANE